MPLNLNNTEVTGVDLNNTEVSEVRLNGQTVFTSGPPIIDDFEDGNVSEWNAQNSRFGLESGADVISGSFSGFGEYTGGSFGNGSFAVSTTGLDFYPSVGDSFEWKFDYDDGAEIQAGLGFGVQPGNNEQNYVIINGGRAFGDDNYRVYKDAQPDGSRNQLANFTGTNYPKSDRPLRIRIDWDSSGFDVTWFNNADTQLKTVRINDSEYTTGGIILWVMAFDNQVSPFRAFVDDIVVI